MCARHVGGLIQTGFDKGQQQSVIHASSFEFEGSLQRVCWDRDLNEERACSQYPSLPFVPVTELMLRGLVRMSMMFGVCTHGIRKCVPSPTFSGRIPRKRSNITARSPPSTAHDGATHIHTQPCTAQSPAISEICTASSV